jgi:hypothetical protein
MLEARSHIDAKLLQLNNNSAAFRLSEESAFIEAMNQEMTGKIFNGNVGTDLKTFSGLATRYSSTTAGNGQNVILLAALVPITPLCTWWYGVSRPCSVHSRRAHLLA